MKIVILEGCYCVFVCFSFDSMLKVLKKTQFPRKEAMDVCHQNPAWKSLIKK